MRRTPDDTPWHCQLLSAALAQDAPGPSCLQITHADRPGQDQAERSSQVIPLAAPSIIQLRLDLDL
jgi:hypothetical protein